ncbi:hypothetical protein DPM19_29425 [Actinomadura craniellae]|uniref:Uncharacterized protein n=1 Tax=Actinomadura craniellae TaxID=2231787 RepID=A0A365H0K8_9ACTN|nr:hypothetical protein DPM19_29425 [Actinomadura craniellae]
MAYLVQPGTGRRVYRLAVARRIVDGALAHRPRGTYAKTRTRVLRRAMDPPRRLRIGLGPWLRALPGRLPDPTLTQVLDGLDPAARAAYVLRRIERTPRYAVRDQLVALGVPDPQPALDAAEAADLPDPATVELVPGRPVRRRSPLPLAAAALLTAALLAALVATETGGPTGSAAERGVRVTAAAPDDWRRGDRKLDAWPARGDLVHDQAVVDRALAAWRPSGRPQLLYAGRLDGVPTVLLRDGDRVARFAGTNARPSVRPISAAEPNSPFALGRGRYLVAPWTTQVRTARGTAVPVQGGVAGPVHAAAGCGAVLELRSSDRADAVADLSDGARPTPVTYRSGGGAPEVGPAGLRQWERLACGAGREPGREITTAEAWRFWTGALPDRGDRAAEWVCARYRYASGGSTARATLLENGRRHATGDCGDRSDAALSGTWWRSPARRWFYLAAASPGKEPRARGPLVGVRFERGLLRATGPRPRRRPHEKVVLSYAR